ncbi:MAG: ATP phosphoribosyltransferase [Promethearchaeota archaeon CR_4]|nr:MAG: ATP phosphoribosyltransferase [Candidatus Lokiarchaeota archaeon CR_4]
MNGKKKLKMTLPKGSLEQKITEFLKSAGYTITGDSRGYRPSINDEEIEIKMLRPQEIPKYLTGDEGFDLGVTGQDWVKENKTDIAQVLDLETGKVRIVLCVPDLPGFWEKIKNLTTFIDEFHRAGKPIRISTEYINTTIAYLMNNPAYKQYWGDAIPQVITPWQTWGSNSNVRIFLSFGATEAKPPEEVDAIIDNTETGTTIRANKLKIIEEVDKSSAILIANKTSMQDEWKREKIMDIAMLCRGVIEAKNKLHIFINVHERNLKSVLEVLPSLKGPTVSKLMGKEEGWYGVNTIISQENFLKIITQLRKLAQGLVVQTPRQIIPLDI